jgi:hypothetical protein
MSASVGSGRLNVMADLTGDSFPNVEVILQDESGVRRMLCRYETDAGADAGPGRLFTKGTDPMNGICRSFGLTEAGRFR